MFELYMFDLDDTLVRVEGLKGVRGACKDTADFGSFQAMRAALAGGSVRLVDNCMALATNVGEVLT